MINSNKTRINLDFIRRKGCRKIKKHGVRHQLLSKEAFTLIEDTKKSAVIRSTEMYIHRIEINTNKTVK